jgi:hypothetical protein
VDSLHGYGSEGWAHFEFLLGNIAPTILPKKIEEFIETSRSCDLQELIERKPPALVKS